MFVKVSTFAFVNKHRVLALVYVHALTTTSPKLLKQFGMFRQKKLEQSLAYQQFSTNVDEEESWINEKNTVVASDDYGDTLAAAQVGLETSIALGFTNTL